MSVNQVTHYKSFGSLCGFIVFSGLYQLATRLCLQGLAARLRLRRLVARRCLQGLVARLRLQRLATHLLCLQQLAARLRLQRHHICACLQQQLAREGLPFDESISAI